MLILDFDFVEQGIRNRPARARVVARRVRDDRQPGLDLHQPAAPAGDLQRQLTRPGPRTRGRRQAPELAARGLRRTSVRPRPRRSAGRLGSARRVVGGLLVVRLGRLARVCGRRRRWRSSTQRPRTPRWRRRPRCRRARCRASLTASTAAAAIGSTPSPRRVSGRGLVVGGQAERGQHRGQQHRRPASGSPRRRGGTGRGRRASPGAAANSGPRIEPSETVRPPSSMTAIVWAAASRRDQVRATCLSGGAIGLMVPRSGQVPTTTSTPASRSRVRPRRGGATDSRGRHHVGHVVGADQDHRDVGLDGQRRSTWPPRSEERAPTRRTRAGRPAGRPARRRRWPAARPGSPRPGRRRSRRRWSRRAARS